MKERSKDISFEKALERLQKIVEELEDGDLALEDSLKKYEEGVGLSRLCQEKLDKAKQKIELLMKDKKGKFAKKDFEEKDAE